MPEDKTEELYAEALELAGYNAMALKAMCLWAYEHIQDKAAMKAASAAWGRNARNFAKAVDYFGEIDEHQSTDDILSLIAISSLPFEDANKIYDDMQDKTLTYWQVRERVAAAKPRRERKLSLAVRVAYFIHAWECIDDKDVSPGHFLTAIADIPEVAKVLKNETE